MALPPLQRLDGAQKGVVRITKTAEVGLLPQDRESLFYLNVREIPPAPNKPTYYRWRCSHALNYSIALVP